MLRKNIPSYLIVLQAMCACNRAPKSMIDQVIRLFGTLDDEARMQLEQGNTPSSAVLQAIAERTGEPVSVCKMYLENFLTWREHSI